MACATFHTINPIEIILYALFKVQENYSERFTAKVSGTTMAGNDPHVVAEYIRKVGLVSESEWPFSEDIKTFEDYYKPLPAKLFDIARKWLDQYDFKHDTVPSNPAAMMEALKYSPLGLSVGYNGLDENGFWYRLGEGRDGHWATCYGYVEGKYWKIFDSYDETHKKVRWGGFKPELVKRYAIAKRDPKQEISRLQQIVNLLLQVLGLQKQLEAQKAPTPPVTPVEPPNSPPPVSPQLSLYDAAKARIGQDLSKSAPNERGCAQSLSRVIADVLPGFPLHLSTITLQAALRKHPHFKQIAGPTMGAVSIFATKGKSVGHCGVVGLTHVMSNTSKTGKWEPNYTHKEWNAAAKKRGLPIVNFILV